MHTRFSARDANEFHERKRKWKEAWLHYAFEMEMAFHSRRTISLEI